VTAHPGPALQITKKGTPDELTAAGQTISYTFLVVNTGNVTIDDLSVADTLSAPAGPALVISCPVTTLAPDASTTCTAPAYKATQADVDNGDVKNTATATGTPVHGDPVTSDPSSVLTPIHPHSALTLTKTGSVSGSATLGDEVTWTIVVANTGTATVRSIQVNDPSGGVVTCPVTTLKPGASVTCTLAKHKVTAGHIDNTATATGSGIDGAVTSPPGSAKVEVSAPLPFTGVASLGPTITAGVAAVIAGIGLLLIAGPRRRRRS
jgi:uncharacterized repeat protein (TIGR01451 family)